MEKEDVAAPQLRISEVGLQFPHIVDVEWRLDYHIKSNSLERIDTPSFVVNLKVLEDGTPRDVVFCCTHEEMQDLVQKLKEASTQIDRTIGKQQQQKK
ncbi:hypothetical protein PAPYR_2186 [Paratrimastix pyriformis]|uniref:COMM domain-containing protein 3 n=1 Tax=Paratrimastix pyriformis TaxID=342808 RepID=A0ABQ8UVI6_9EUKA|nr:hypothetical protein PAPYR_2186 [Paratrimastix pyriformis]